MMLIANMIVHDAVTPNVEVSAMRDAKVVQDAEAAYRPSGLPDISTVAGVVHDLGNLIQVAYSAVNIVARSGIAEGGDIAPVIAGAKTSLEQAGALVRRTISLAKRESEAEEVCLATCLAEIGTLVESTWDRRFQLDVDVRPDLPGIRCDSLELKNAILNLLINARDAMPDGGTISLRAGVNARQGTIALRVADTGIGMTSETVRRAFDPYFTTKSGGLGGVGLAMVERFVREVGGEVSIDSEVNAGTAVTMHFPRSDVTKAFGYGSGACRSCVQA